MNILEIKNLSLKISDKKILDNINFTLKEKEITRLKDEAAENQRIMLELSKAEAEARSESDEVIKSIPQDIKQSHPYNASAPRNVVEFLRR